MNADDGGARQFIIHRSSFIIHRSSFIFAVYLCLSVFICGSSLLCSSAEEKVFEPAFGPEQIDFTQTKQIVAGVAAEADPERVKKVLGFYEAGSNWEQKKWDLGKPTQAGTTVFQYLLVLKQPVEVGGMAACPADLGSYKGSQNNGEVWYLKDGAALPRNPADDTQGEGWVKAECTTGQPPGMRFFVLPAGTKTQAFVYKDVRVAGQSAIDYWRFYKRRLFNAASTATGYSCPGGDPETVPSGQSWEVKQQDAKTPAWYILAWDAPQALRGVFLYSSVTKYQFFVYKGGPKSSPAIAPETDWEPLTPAVEENNTHTFPNYKYFYRWLGLTGAPTRAIKLQVLTSDGRAWVSGLGAFVDLKREPPPAVAKRDVGPPFRIPVTWPDTGEAAMAVDTKDGRRVRNLRAQVEVRKGADECAWDLRDDGGNYVPPGTYQFKAICAPPLQLLYQMTPCPNVDQFWPDRVPWLTSHDGCQGWLSDHCQNWAVATRGDRLYFGAPMAEAGVCLIECDLDGKKLWGKHDFGAWQGVNLMAADDEAVYVERNGTVFRMNAETRAAKELFSYNKNPERRGYLSAMAAYKGTLCLAFTGEQWLDNAIAAASVDLDRCVPKPPGGDLLRLLRLTSTPPGKDAQPKSDKPQGNGRLDLESAPPASGGKPKAAETELELAVGERATQHAAIAFRQPVPLGSLVFPAPEDGVKARFSILKPNAPYPPRPGEEADWEAFESQPQPGWNCLPAPRNAMTRALRVSFTRTTPAKGEWFGRLEGLKLLRRRFTGLNAKAKVRVNSGAVDANGAWDAKRTEAVAREKPGVYVLEWPQAEKVRGLAIKEVDGAVTEIDVWQGPVQGDVPLEGPALDKKSRENGWRNVATYTQRRRSAQYNDECNKFARYMDGYVDFNAEIETRAIRLRVVEQWLDNGPDNAECRNHDGRSEHGMHYTQSYAAKLDTRCCAILGVAPLQYLGGEPAVEPCVYERLEVYDGKTGKLVKEWPLRLGWHGLSFGPQGELFAIAKDHENILKVDVQTGDAKVAVAGAEPNTMTVGPDGLVYVHPWSNNSTAPLSVWSPDGKKLRTIGKPGGWKPGPWDPERFGPVHRLCVDRNQNLWVLETDNYPRRIVQYKTDGTFVKEIIGNTWYGGTGGGNINRYDVSRAYYGRVEFELDWQKHTSRVRGLLADSLLGQDLVAVKVAGQKPTYLVSAQFSMNSRQPFGAVYIYDEAKGAVRLVAAVGDATSCPTLRTSGVLSSLKGAVPKEYTFTWSDRNGNGLAEQEEVVFEKKPDIRREYGVGRFDEQLGCVGEGVWYQVREFLADGTPVYERKKIPGAPHFRLSSGNLLTLYSSPAPNKPSENFATTPAGEKLWGYPAGGGVSGLSITPWRPGLVGNEFGIIGHETAPAGELGEFVVIHANTGQWHIWTADGLLAGQVMLHKHDPRARFFGPVPAPPGTRLDPLSVNQEHFHGFFTRSEQDNRYYAIAGFTHMSIIEVQGLDKFRRVNAEVRVTDDDLAKVRAWEAVQLQRKIERRAMLIQAAHMAHSPAIDGKKVLTEWPATSTLESNAQATFSIGYDDTNLYLCWTSKGMGALRNSGTDFQRFFKTGACADFMLGTDPASDPARTKPAQGDLRLLLTYANGQPKAVLYQPVAARAPAADAWKTFTQAGGETAFARVALLSDVKMAMTEDKDGYTLEASAPLATLGLQPKPGLRLKMDWGILTTSDGNQVKQRACWANQLATGTSDEAIEARLEPHLWGHLGF